MAVAALIVVLFLLEGYLLMLAAGIVGLALAYVEALVVSFLAGAWLALQTLGGRR